MQFKHAKIIEKELGSTKRKWCNFLGHSVYSTACTITQFRMTTNSTIRSREGIRTPFVWRSFSVTGLNIWNSVSPDIRQTTSYATFWKKQNAPVCAFT